MPDPSVVLEALTSLSPVQLQVLPTQNGIYALHDHLGQIRYIGVTGKNDKGFRGRVANRHVTGSEWYSHKFSQAYNTGRMWRSRTRRADQRSVDADLSKRLRTAFIRKHCRATYFVVETPTSEPIRFFTELEGLERAVKQLAHPVMRSWDGKNFPSMSEPTHLVDALLIDLNWPDEYCHAVERQAIVSLNALP